ncbi:S8 family serine peptidase [Mycoplasmopsis bovirhinis]|uniref:Peptidase S8/S53 domain-containing protein n=1 Tax=Mycoplasmopsis bovirhinis TaxID=29553 RepID=A0A449ADY4_9BACT|nr:S8 family serine peptidase [Mycoplasmopsis bovirhinis]VEU63200.1 Uncharacterised protein [Mycoplasmopsis bovirhinis]
MKQKKLKYLFFSILAMSSATTMVIMGQNNKTLINNLNTYENSKFYEITNNSIISNSQDAINIQKAVGVKRFDIIFKGSTDSDLKDKIKIIAEKYLKTKKENLVYIIGDFLKTISIAITNSQDYDKFKEELNKYGTEDEDVSSVFGFKTDYTHEDFINKRKNESVVTTTSINTDNNPRFNLGVAFDYRGSDNYHLYNLVGLSKDIIFSHFKEYVNKNPIKVGILEAKGVINNDLSPFYWNKKYGNGAHWRNEFFYTESYSNHANNVGEILVGQKGINPTATLWSVELNTRWNGLAGEMNFFLGQGVKIVNNSWGVFDPKNNKESQVYNNDSHYFDELIKSNPELVNFISAGNNFETWKKDGKLIEAYEPLAGIALSKNSIVIGAINNDYLQTKTNYSQIGSDKNYITAVTSGGSYNFSTRTDDDFFSGSGTSFSTPVITALTSMVIQRNPYWFNLGHDSIIAKSAIISGSVKPRYTNAVYTNETGFGIPQFEFVDQAVKNLKYHKKTGPKFTTNHSIYLNKGDTIRANISWLAEVRNKQNIVDFDLKVYDPSNTLLTSSILGERNTETVEFTAQKSGYYNFNLLRYDSNDIKRDLAFTYAIKRPKN